MRLPHLQLILVILCAFACTVQGQTAGKGDRSKTLQPSRITVENYERIKSRNDSITETEVVSILGPPSIVIRRATSDNDYNMIWEHRTFIEVQLKNDRVRHIAGDFSPYLTSLTSDIVTLPNFKRIRVGMTEDDVRKILGTPTGTDSALAANFYDEGDSLAWEELQALSLDSSIA